MDDASLIDRQKLQERSQAACLDDVPLALKRARGQIPNEDSQTPTGSDDALASTVLWALADGSAVTEISISLRVDQHDKHYRRFLRDPAAFAAAAVRKPPEVRLTEMYPKMREEFQKAKGVGVFLWLDSACCEAVEHSVL